MASTVTDAKARQDTLEAKMARASGRSATVTFTPEPEPETVFCPIISADDHLLEPPHLFEGRMPKALADQAPKIVVDDVGLPWWHVDGTELPIKMLNGAAGRAITEWGTSPVTYEEVRAGAWDPKRRLADMDLTGVWANLCFPSDVWSFAGVRFSTMNDPEVGLACMQAYNDWMIDEWCAAAPERYIPMQIPWFRDAEVAAAEIYKNAERGFTAVSFSENPEGRGFPNVYNSFWDPFFHACEETGTVINLHVGTSGSTRTPCSSTALAAAAALFPESAIEALIDWTYAHIPLRFPDIKVVLSEGGADWLPMALVRLTRMDRFRGSHLNSEWPADAPPPQEVALRNFWFTSIEDPAAFHLLDMIGDDRIMVETDYPHFDSTWPHSQRMIKTELGHLDPAVVRKVCFETAAALYRHPLPPEEMIAASEIGQAQAAAAANA